MINPDDSRAAFEAWAKSPPFEHRCTRYPPDHAAWPGVYENICVEFAWLAWQAAIEHSEKLLDLIRRAYVVLHKLNWEQGETDAELSEAINAAMSDILGNDWVKQ